MAANITAAEIQAAGGWSETDISTTDLATDAFIPAGDAWITQLLGMTLTAYTALYTTKGALAKAAEIFYVCWLVASRPAREDVKIGPLSYKPSKDKEKEAAAFMKKAKDLLAECGISVKTFSFTYKRGADYHESGFDNTNIDFMSVGPNKPFSPLGAGI